MLPGEEQTKLESIVKQLGDELLSLQKRFGIDPNRCPKMLENAYGEEQCGRSRDHEGTCCFLRGD